MLSKLAPPKRKKLTRYQHRWLIRVGTGGRDESFTFIGTETEARTAEAAAKVDHERKRGKGCTSATKLTFGEWADEWRRTWKEKLSPSHQRVVEGQLRRWILPYLADRPLASLTRREISAWRADTKDDGIPEHQYVNCYRALSSILGKAVGVGLLEENPALGLKQRTVRAPSRRRALPPTEIEAIRIEMRTLTDVVLLNLMAYAGLRPGEAYALKWNDLLPDARAVTRIVVDETFTDGVFKPPKNKEESKEDRIVRDLPAPFLDDLALITPPSGELVGLIAPNPRDGEPWSAQNWRNRFAAARERARVGGQPIQPAKPYELRHSAATLWIASGMRVKRVADQLGHDQAVTLKTYSHDFDIAEDGSITDPSAAIRAARRPLPDRLLAQAVNPPATPVEPGRGGWNDLFNF